MLAFHDADTNTDTDSPNTSTILRPTHVGVVECQLNAILACHLSRHLLRPSLSCRLQFSLLIVS